MGNVVAQDLLTVRCEGLEVREARGDLTVHGLAVRDDLAGLALEGRADGPALLVEHADRAREAAPGV